jgi:hypothetical protein
MRAYLAPLPRHSRSPSQPALPLRFLCSFAAIFVVLRVFFSSSLHPSSTIATTTFCPHFVRALCQGTGVTKTVILRATSSVSRKRPHVALRPFERFPRILHNSPLQNAPHPLFSSVSMHPPFRLLSLVFRLSRAPSQNPLQNRTSRCATSTISRQIPLEWPAIFRQFRASRLLALKPRAALCPGQHYFAPWGCGVTAGVLLCLLICCQRSLATSGVIRKRVVGWDRGWG